MLPSQLHGKCTILRLLSIEWLFFPERGNFNANYLIVVSKKLACIWNEIEATTATYNKSVAAKFSFTLRYWDQLQ